MNNKIIYTVPHSGTHFISTFLESLGMKQEVDYRIAHAQYNKPREFDGFYESKFIVTLREPRLTAETELANTPPRGQQIMLNNFVKCWDAFIEMLPKIDYCMVDLNTTDRYEQLHKAALHFGLTNDVLIKKYAESWSIINSKDRIYPLSNLDYSGLNDAVDWYELVKRRKT